MKFAAWLDVVAVGFAGDRCRCLGRGWVICRYILLSAPFTNIHARALVFFDSIAITLHLSHLTHAPGQSIIRTLLHPPGIRTDSSLRIRNEGTTTARSGGEIRGIGTRPRLRDLERRRRWLRGGTAGFCSSQYPLTPISRVD